MKRTTEPSTATEEHSSKPAPTITAEQHGTPYGYQKGCRIEEECPNYGSTALTCREASRRYQREYAENRKKREAAGLAKPTPAPPSKPLTVEPLNEQARADADLAEKVTIADLKRDLSRPDDELDALNAQIEQLIIDRDAAESRITNLATALAAEEEAHALTRKQYDNMLAEVRRRHEADARDLEESRATQLAETNRANALQERLDVANAARRAVDRIATSHVPEVVPAAPATTVMTVGDVRLELPAGEVAQLKVDLGGVHVQIGR
jgi:hypothetical protein